MRATFLAALFFSLLGCSASSSEEVASGEGASKTACTPKLASRAPGSLASTKEAFESGCTSTTQWCRMTDIRAFALDDCDGSAGVDDATALVQQETAFEDQELSWEHSGPLDASALGAKTYFATHGPALLGEIAAWVGSTDVVGHELVAELPCPNCHDFRVRYVLYYPKKRVVVVVDGSHGYDS